jgi:hypothetical protein
MPLLNIMSIGNMRAKSSAWSRNIWKMYMNSIVLVPKRMIGGELKNRHQLHSASSISSSNNSNNSNNSHSLSRASIQSQAAIAAKI